MSPAEVADARREVQASIRRMTIAIYAVSLAAGMGAGGALGLIAHMVHP